MISRHLDRGAVAAAPGSLASAPSPKQTPSSSSVHAASAFAVLGLVPELTRALAEEGYVTPTPIQTEAIGPALRGRDLLCCAQTGTGKTAAFVLPTLQRLARDVPKSGKIRALVLTPTRELAAQIGERAGAYGKHLGLKHTVIYGGVGQRPQEEAIRRRPDLLIATPGRLLDLVQQRLVDLSGITVLVLDEADRMLDMGFIHDVRRVLAVVPKVRQTLFFSATVPAEVQKLAQSLLVSPVEIAVTPERTTAETVRQSVHHVSRADKRAVLERILRGDGAERVIVFTRTKHGANRLSDQLGRAGVVSAAIHGNQSQGARERALESFRVGSTQVLVATDIAARGIDVDGVSLVVNYELPNVPESYVHRIGRTGRAGSSGAAVSLCDETERTLLRDIERFLGNTIPVASGAVPLPSAGRAPMAAPVRTSPAPVRTSPAPVRTSPAPAAPGAAPAPRTVPAAPPGYSQRRGRHFGPRRGR
ncbi:MAG: DEAD/DEAH box helicase [Polyangiaceae bacterium]